MHLSKRTALLTAAATVAAGCLFIEAFAKPAVGTTTVAVRVDHPGGTISPTMFGIFFEDINFSADGGLYPERIKNRSFEFTEPLTAWTRLAKGGAEGELDIRSDGALNENNPHYLRLRIYNPGSGYGVTNSGFRGIGVQQGAAYKLSAYVRMPGTGPHAVRAALVDEKKTSLVKLS